MLQIKNVSYAIGERTLFHGIDWSLQPERRAALIGPNGAGKTTLFRIITGELQQDSGEIIKPKGYRVGYLPQEETDIQGKSALDTAMKGHQEIALLERQLVEIHDALDAGSTDQNKLLAKLGNLEHRYEDLGGYQLEVRAKSILSGLGFNEAEFQSSLSELSGGWRMRVYLARLLLDDPDLLLLDEPTNHLDLPSLEWLEQYLLQFTGCVIIISHDRFFIDRLAHEIYELDQGKFDRYAGNYHFYEQEREKRLELLLKMRESQESERKRQERFIERFRAKNTKASQVQSRIKHLAKIEVLEVPLPPPRIHFQLHVPVSSYKDVLHIEDLHFRYDESWILRDINCDVSRGERVALVGPNGAGKTTLTKLVVHKLQPQKGSISLGKRTVIGYYAQHQLEMLNPEETVYDEVLHTSAANHIPHIRNVLGAFQFSGDDVYKKIKILSGGEKARVSLAKILLSPVNFLIMDEPTNHLDMMSVESLEQALSHYAGTLLVISHDRYFLDKIVGRVFELIAGKLQAFHGNYSDYVERRDLEGDVHILPEKRQDTFPSAGRKTKEQKRLEAEARQAISEDRNRLEREIGVLEEKINLLEIRKKEIEEEMAQSETYERGNLIVALQKEYTNFKKELEVSYVKWEDAKLALEELLSQLN
ncbi:ABC-F family ATP-binding cassette domain-containing protein [Acidobacteriota bacterium]